MQYYLKKIKISTMKKQNIKKIKLKILFEKLPKEFILETRYLDMDVYYLNR